MRLPAGPVLAVASLAMPAALVLAQRTVPGLNPVLHAPVTHIVVVVGISLVATVVSVLSALAALRRRRGEPLLLALGSLWLVVLFLGHGLITPGVFDRAGGPWLVRLPVLALAGFALCQALSVLRVAEPVRRLVAARGGAVLLGGGLLAALLTGTAVQQTPFTTDLAAPTATAPSSTPGFIGPPSGVAPAAPRPSHHAPSQHAPSQHAPTPLTSPTTLGLPGGLGGYASGPWQVPVGVVSGLLLALAGLVHARRWQVGRDGVELMLALACGTAAEAAVALLVSDVWAASWWDYHGLLLVGFGSTVVATWLATRRGTALPDVLDGRWLRDPSVLLEHGSPEVLHALVAAVEAKHVATRGHSSRVSALSVQLGERLGLSPARLRVAAQGALLHDIGKIGVPDDILSKPGPLTAQERARIEEHPVIGWEIVRQAPSLAAALDMVRHHHERVDGTGYPDGLAGDGIPLLARLVAVADVYDALTSARDYRAGLEPGPRAGPHGLGPGHALRPGRAGRLPRPAGRAGARAGRVRRQRSARRRGPRRVPRGRPARAPAPRARARPGPVAPRAGPHDPLTGRPRPRRPGRAGWGHDDDLPHRLDRRDRPRRRPRPARRRPPGARPRPVAGARPGGRRRPDSATSTSSPVTSRSSPTCAAWPSSCATSAASTSSRTTRACGCAARRPAPRSTASRPRSR